MITREQAEVMFAEMVAKSEKKYRIDAILDIAFDDPLYVMMVTDENGEQLLPGERFPSIRKADGSLVKFEYPCPA